MLIRIVIFIISFDWNLVMILSINIILNSHYLSIFKDNNYIHTIAVYLIID